MRRWLPALTVALCLSVGVSPTFGRSQGFGIPTIMTLTNEAGANAVDVSIRGFDGVPVRFLKYSTGGQGTGAGLGSQGALALSGDGQFLLGVDAGSNEVVVFRAYLNGLLLLRTSHVSSGGDEPISVAIWDDLVYVLNAGSPESVVGFKLNRVGRLKAIPGAQYLLSTTDPAGAQVGFSPDGKFLVVAEKTTSSIAVFPVQGDGTLGARVDNPSAGTTPFGFGFDDYGTLIVSEAFGGATDASAVSSYSINANGTLQTISASVPTDQTAACWIAIPRQGGFAYTTNTGSGSVTGYSIGMDGSLTRLDPGNPRTGDPNGATDTVPIDADFDEDGRYLYVLQSGTHDIATYYRRNDGSLVYLGASHSPLPDSAVGLIAQ